MRNLPHKNANQPIKRPRNSISRSRKRARLLEGLLDALSTKKRFKKIRRTVLNGFGLAFLIVGNLFILASVILRYGEWLYRELASVFGW